MVPVDARNRLEWVRGEQQHVPRLARRAGVDVIHSLASTAPLRGSIPRVTTIHDPLYLKVPEAHFGLRGLGMRVLVPAAARRSRRVIVDAASTRRDLVEELGVAVAKVDVVPLAADSASPVPGTPAGALRESLGLGDRRGLLSVSAKRPHKNLPRLLRALAAPLRVTAGAGGARLPDASRGGAVGLVRRARNLGRSADTGLDLG